MNYRFTLSLLAFVLVFSACKKDDDTPTPDPNPTYNVPTTYEFTGVDYSKQTTLLGMFTKLDSVTNRGKDEVLSKDLLLNMYANTNNPFNNNAYNTSGIKMKNSTYAPGITTLEFLLDTLAKTSKEYTATAQKGKAGVVTSSTNATTRYLVDAQGVEFRQVISKMLMGSMIYHQIVNAYLSDTALANPSKAKREYYWDQAFGLFGVPVNFPTVTTGLKYVGNYSNQVNPAIGSNAKIMNAYLKGRAAISNDDMTTAKAQANILEDELEKVLAGAIIRELNAAKTNITNPAAKLHYLSEAWGFVLALKYLPNKTITDTQLDATLAAIGTNLWDTDLDDIANATNNISSVYGFDSVKNQF